MSGIYCIENITNNKKYIGYTTNSIKTRFLEHKSRLNNETHRNRYLQRSWIKYGSDNFHFYSIQKLDNNAELLKTMEIYWICYHNSYVLDGGGYNLTRGGEGTHDYKWTEEQKKNNIYFPKGHVPWNKGIPCSEEQKEAISSANKGNQYHLGYTHSKDVRERISKNGTGMTGKHHSEETKNKMSEAQKGIKSYMYGKKRSREIRKKISEGLMGRPVSSETREKIGKSNSLEKDIVVKIKNMLNQNIPASEIAVSCNVCKPTIYKVKNGGYDDIYKI